MHIRTAWYNAYPVRFIHAWKVTSFRRAVRIMVSNHHYDQMLHHTAKLLTEFIEDAQDLNAHSDDHEFYVSEAEQLATFLAHEGHPDYFDYEPGSLTDALA
jgi:hypothetical protein